MADIRLHPSPEYEFPQPKISDRLELPSRLIFVAPSGAGKTVTLVSLLLDILIQRGRSCFSRIFVVSPSINVDAQWQALKDFQRDKMGVSEEEDSELYHERYDEAKLAELVERQRRITERAKELGLRKLFGVCFIFDDVADDPHITRYSTPLHQLYVRGRHYGCTTICSVQSYRVLHPLIRRNATGLLVWRLRNAAEKKAILEEQSALYPVDVLEKFYEEATGKPHGFLYINLVARDRADLMWEGFTHKLRVRERAD